MYRGPFALVFVFLAALQQIAAHQAAGTFRVATASGADVHLETLEAVNPASKQATEVFPGRFESVFGAAVMRRIETLRGRVDGTDRDALMASKAEAGFDRSIIRWRADAAGTRVALAVRYYREPLFQLDLQMTDDYGRAEPVDPERFEFFAIAVCSRAADAWTCREEPLADVTARHKVPLPQNRAERLAAAEKLVDIVLAGK